MPYEVIDLDKIPQIVRNKAKQVFDKLKWISAVKVENDDRKIAYELDGTRTINGSKDEVTVTITNDGKMVEYDVYVSDPTRISPKVLAAVKVKFPNFELVESHKYCLGEDIKDKKDGEIFYELFGKRGKFNVQAQVSKDGNILEFVYELIDKKKLPKIVSDALDKSNGVVFEADSVYVIDKDNKTIGYKFEGKDNKNRSKCFFVTADGKRVERVEE
jgi:hypothetical protein